MKIIHKLLSDNPICVYIPTKTEWARRMKKNILAYKKKNKDLCTKKPNTTYILFKTSLASIAYDKPTKPTKSPKKKRS